MARDQLARVVGTVLVVDAEGVVIAATDSALRLLRLPPSIVGAPVANLVTHRRLADLITGRSDAGEDDAVVLVHDQLLEVTRARLGDESEGVLVLVRDKSGVIELLSELGGAKAYADALTAQHRDHVNRLHLLIGLLQLGSYDEAVEYLTELQRVTPGLAPDPDGAAPVDPSLSALLLGKASIAAERGIAVRFTGITAIEELAIDNGSLICVMSNLLDNAMDALAGVLDPRIDIDVSATQDETRLVVRDNGPGIPESTDVFADGFTTKAARGLIHRGLGLALVRHLVLRSGGSVDAHNNAGAVFTVTWPAHRDPEQEQW